MTDNTTAQAAGGARGSILVVDDNPTNLQTILDLLDVHKRFEVTTALSGTEALELAELAQPDLILLDVMMPGIDGFETCKRLKANPVTASIPVIFMTALSEERHQLRGFTLGAVDYVTKPLQEPVLIARIETHLRLQAQRRDLVVARKAAEAASEAKSAFLSKLSHELRTPLTGVLGLLDAAEDGGLSAEDREAMRGSGLHLLSLIDDLLSAARGSLDAMALSESPQPILPLVRQCVATFRPRAEAKGLRFRLDAPEGALPTARFDPKRIRQILINLIDNAIKFSDEGEVVVSVRCEQPTPETLRCRFEVRDTGYGIEANAFERIQSAFVQLTQAQSAPTSEGIGLGLHITSLLLERMGSKLEIQSAPGEGSVFAFELSWEVCEAAPETAAEPAAAERGDRNLRLLIVDDMELIRGVIRRLLKRKPLDIEEAGSIAEALASVEACPPDLVFVDQHLPDGSGRDLAAQLRERPGFERVRFVTMTADNDAAAANLATGMFYAALPKPFEAKGLRLLIDECIGK